MNPMTILFTIGPASKWSLTRCDWLLTHRFYRQTAPSQPPSAPQVSTKQTDPPELLRNIEPRDTPQISVSFLWHSSAYGRLIKVKSPASSGWFHRLEILRYP